MQMFALNSWQMQDDKRSQLVLPAATSLTLFIKHKRDVTDGMLRCSDLTLLTPDFIIQFF